jgi:hypothetical protein
MKIPVHIQFGLSYILEFGDYIISIFWDITTAWDDNGQCLW